mmetsp:Transcript_26295/g.63365  ORF Transcript_26295/g.63365 Transcript_26295/m.63365 type:complete len:218 (-) Transcript_26295:213-866(-)
MQYPETRTRPWDDDKRGEWAVGDYVKISYGYIEPPFGYQSYERSMNEIKGRFARIIGFEKDQIALVRLSTLMPARREVVRVKPEWLYEQLERFAGISKFVAQIIGRYTRKMTRRIPPGAHESKYIYFVPLSCIRTTSKKLFLENARPPRVYYEGIQVNIVQNDIKERKSNETGCPLCDSMASWGIKARCGPCRQRRQLVSRKNRNRSQNDYKKSKPR